jgi:hypothetical protein
MSGRSMERIKQADISVMRHRLLLCLKGETWEFRLRTWLIDNYTEGSYPAFYEELRNEMDKYYHPLGDGKLTVIPKGERL